MGKNIKFYFLFLKRLSFFFFYSFFFSLSLDEIIITGWMEPLLDRIKMNPKTVVCPVIDVIDDNTFEYHYSKAYFTNVGGFDWSLQFNWHSIPEKDRAGRRHIDPVK